MFNLFCLILYFFVHRLAIAETIPGERVSYQNLQNHNYSYVPVASKSLEFGSTLEGRPLFEEVLFQRSLGHFDRERIPERVVHAKGSTYYGTFITNGKNDLSRYTMASVFQPTSGPIKVAVRFSTALGSRGSSDTPLGEVRGMAVKFYAEDGNYDLLSINFPIFFINDPQLFPHLTHSQKPDPRSELFNGDRTWDFFSLRPETLNLITLLYSDYGTPDGFRHMAAFSVNAFRLIPKSGNTHYYGKFTWIPDQGVKNLNRSHAIYLAGLDPDYARRDLFQAIENKNFPSWTLYVQIVTIKEATRDFIYNPFDATKMWPIDRYPLREVGRLTLNRNIQNAFAENEQIAFNPGNLIAGIEPSSDRLLHGRLFSYQDTQFHRLGANHRLIPVNREPFRIQSERDGPGRMDGNLGSSENFFPNSHKPVVGTDYNYAQLYGMAGTPFTFSVDDIIVERPDSLEQQYLHARETYFSLTDDERNHLHSNLAYIFSGITKSSILNRIMDHLSNISPMYSMSVRAELWRMNDGHWYP